MHTPPLVQVSDIDEKGLLETAELVRSKGVEVVAFACDISSDKSQQSLFQKHAQAFDRLDLAFLNAGIGERTELLSSDDERWKATLDVDLTAVITGWWHG